MATLLSRLQRLVGLLLLGLIRLYQVTLSPLLGNACRFHPTCSRYTAACIERFGPFRGTALGIRRILRCHPFHPGGFDPPPEEWPARRHR